MRRPLFALVASSSFFALGACVTSGPAPDAPGLAPGVHVVAADMPKRAALMDPVKSLEGTWDAKTADGQTGVIEFKVSSAGSVVREIMFPGHEHEMTNVYHLDGNDLVVTHYCAAGNQPRMRAHAKNGNKILFDVDSVTDLQSADQHYMGNLTVEFIDRDHVKQHWRSYDKGKLTEPMVFELTRRAAR